jgi:hypothetical protein
MIFRRLRGERNTSIAVAALAVAALAVAAQAVAALARICGVGGASQTAHIGGCQAVPGIELFAGAVARVSRGCSRWR